MRPGDTPRIGRKWCFGMKTHITVDDSFGVIQSLATTSAKADDLRVVVQRLHSEEEHA